MVDLAAVEVNFDGITYAKGASVLKQLAAYVGFEEFLTGLRAYFARSTPSATPPSTTCCGTSTAASGRDLHDLVGRMAADHRDQHAQRRRSRSPTDGTFTSFDDRAGPARRPAPASCRPHRLAIGIYDDDDAGRAGPHPPGGTRRRRASAPRCRSWSGCGAARWCWSTTTI